MHWVEYDKCMQDESMQSKGGRARRDALTPEQRAQIAKQAAEARWGAPKALHRGNFKEEFGFNVDCFVLDDAQKTAVISQSGMGEALGLSRRGNAFPRFLGSKAMADAVGAQLGEKLENPIKFQGIKGGALHGYDVTILIDVCRAILDVEKSLDRQQKHVAAQARVILNASAKSGIRGLVYALAGYNPTAEEVITAFKLYVRDEAKNYEKEFPREIYQAWYRLYDIPPIQGRGRPWQFKKLTVEHIYMPLAKSNGRILELARALKVKDEDGRKKKLFQFLSDVGTRALRVHLGRVLEMAEDSPDKATYETRIAKRFGDQPEIDAVIVEPEN